LNENLIKAEGCREVFMALPQCTVLASLAYACRFHASRVEPALTRRLPWVAYLGNRCVSLNDNGIRVDNPAAFSATWEECPSLQDLEYIYADRGKRHALTHDYSRFQL